jgi:hypothetical protein
MRAGEAGRIAATPTALPFGPATVPQFPANSVLIHSIDVRPHPRQHAAVRGGGPAHHEVGLHCLLEDVLHRGPPAALLPALANPCVPPSGRRPAPQHPPGGPCRPPLRRAGSVAAGGTVNRPEMKRIKAGATSGSGLGMQTARRIAWQPAGPNRCEASGIKLRLPSS